MSGWRFYEQAYPDAEPGEKARGPLRMPVGRPEPGPPKPKAARKSGGECDVRRTLGLVPRGPVSPDDQVHDWRPV